MAVVRQALACKSAFLEWCDRQGLSVIGGYGVEDLKTAPLKNWQRLGAPAAYCHLDGSQSFVGVLRRSNLSEREGGHLLEHEDEPPEIRAMYEAELRKEGILLRMAKRVRE